MNRADMPLPVGAIMHSPMMTTASGPVYRCVIVLALAYWRAGCRLPATDNVTLASLCRLPLAHLRPIKPAVLAVLAEVTPTLDAECARLLRSYGHKVKAAQRMRDGKAVKQAARALQQRAPQSALVVLPLPTRGSPLSRRSGSTAARHPPARTGTAPTFAGTFSE